MRTVPATKIGRTLTSVSSCPRSVCGMLESSRQKRLAAELPQEGGQPDAAEADRGGEVHPMDAESLRRELRDDHPEEVDEAHAADRPRHHAEEQRPPLHATRQQEKERQREMKDDQRDRDREPAMPDPVEVPGDLLGKIPGPDNEVLREG